VDLLKNFEAPTLGAKVAELEVASKDEVKQATKKRRERQETSNLFQSQIQQLLVDANPQDDPRSQVEVPVTQVAASVNVVPPFLQHARTVPR
jgi:hypothetical protein